MLYNIPQGARKTLCVVKLRVRILIYLQLPCLLANAMLYIHMIYEIAAYLGPFNCTYIQVMRIINNKKFNNKT